MVQGWVGWVRLGWGHPGVSFEHGVEACEEDSRGTENLPGRWVFRAPKVKRIFWDVRSKVKRIC